MVRILFPPAVSQQRTVPAVGFDGARLARSPQLTSDFLRICAALSSMLRLERQHDAIRAIVAQD